MNIYELVGYCGKFTVPTPVYKKIMFKKEGSSHGQKFPLPECGEISPTTSKPTDPSTTETPKPTMPCSKDNDLLFLLDGSGSIGIKRFNMAKQFLAKMSTAFTKPKNNRLALIKYSYKEATRLELPLDNNFTSEAIAGKILNIVYEKGETYTGNAITIATEELISKIRERIPPVPQSILILTDGNSDDNIINPVAAAKRAGIRTFAVGIGNRITEKNLLELADNIKERVYKVTSYEELGTLLYLLIKDLCP